MGAIRHWISGLSTAIRHEPLRQMSLLRRTLYAAPRGIAPDDPRGRRHPHSIGVKSS